MTAASMECPRCKGDGLIGGYTEMELPRECDLCGGDGEIKTLDLPRSVTEQEKT